MQKLAAPLARAFRDPLAWVSLGVDLLPILAIAAFGWGAVALVALYWLENLVIGVFTILRMVGAGFFRPAMLAVCLFTVPFFCAHYGLFSYGHGLFVRELAGAHSADDTISGLIGWALGTGAHMPLFVAAIALINAAFYARDYIIRGEARESNPFQEMFMPYDRIITLHVALILGALLTLKLGQPLLGVLFLLLIRVAYGLLTALRRRKKRDTQLAEGQGAESPA